MQLRIISLGLLLSGLIWSSLGLAQAKVRVLACEPEWAALAQAVGGANVQARSATTGLQDPHYIEARPSLIAQARQADLLICTGAGLEEGWLPLLLQKSGNRRIQAGQAGHLMASDAVQLLDIPSHVDRSMGHVHAQGNPHIQIDPRRLAQVATVLMQRLVQIDLDNASDYRQQHQQFAQRWKQAIQRWEQQARPLRGQGIVVHHKSWVYLEDWLGLIQVDTLEPKPGIPPTTTHLSSLLQDLQQTPASMIVYAAYQNPQAAQWLSGKTGLPAVKLPSTVGGTAAASDLFTLFDDIIQRLQQAQASP